MQRQRDQAAGLNTGGFISGYRGSPLGVYDNALWQARRFLERANVYFQPGVNEDLAATSVWGSQQTTLFPGATVDGVFGIWYGKGPGVDRSIDALKHANAAGTAPHGGVLAIAGDDHGCQSSTLRASERAGLHRRDDADPQSRDGAGVSRFRPPGLRAVALFRLLGRLQGDGRGGGELGLGLDRSASASRS